MLSEHRPATRCSRDGHERPQALSPCTNPSCPSCHPCPPPSYKSPSEVSTACMSKHGVPQAWSIHTSGEAGVGWPWGVLTVWLSSSFLSAGLSVWEAAFLLTQGGRRYNQP